MFIDIHTHNFVTEENVFSIKNLFAQDVLPDEKQFYSIGLHPWHLLQVDTNVVMTKLQESAKWNKVLAIGEAGLDKKIQVSIELQQNIYLEHISLAEELNKPLIIHCVKAYNEILAVKKELKSSAPWIIHGFNGNQYQADELLKYNIYLSFGKALLSDGSKASVSFLHVPMDRFFLETDVYEGGIRSIYEKAAELKKITMEILQEQMIKNFENVFGYDASPVISF